MYAGSSGIILLDIPTLTTPREYIAVRPTTDALDPSRVSDDSYEHECSFRIGLAEYYASERDSLWLSY